MNLGIAIFDCVKIEDFWCIFTERSENNAFEAQTQPFDWLELSETILPVAAATSNRGGDQVI